MAVTPQDEPTPEIIGDEDITETFDSFASTLPETASGFLDTPPISTPSSVRDAQEGTSEDTGLPTDVPPERKRVNVTKKVRRAMNRFKGKMADVGIMWFHQQAKTNPEWELDKDEQELLKDAVETVWEVLDVEVEIQPLSWTLTSVWWVISYPILAFLFLFLTKKSKTLEREQRERDVQ